MNKTNITKRLSRFVSRFQKEHSTDTMWRPPLVGFASAGDPLFLELRRVVSPTHALPGDLLQTVGTVVVFFLPFHESIARSNIHEQSASLEWAKAYLETNALIKASALDLKHHLESEGHAVAVTPPTHNFDPKKLVSDWSHRHVAFVAGVGRFGLNNMMITESGCCGRLGSLVTSLELPPDLRPIEEKCLYRYKGSCKRCVKRCVDKALFSDEFLRHNCYKVCLENKEKHIAIGKADVCGKCLVDVPCAFVDPVKKLKSAAVNEAAKDGESVGSPSPPVS